MKFVCTWFFCDRSCQILHGYGICAYVVAVAHHNWNYLSFAWSSFVYINNPLPNLFLHLWIFYLLIQSVCAWCHLFGWKLLLLPVTLQFAVLVNKWLCELMWPNLSMGGTLQLFKHFLHINTHPNFIILNEKIIFDLRYKHSWVLIGRAQYPL